MPKLSIITVTYNALRDLPATLESIRHLATQSVEFIVVDGGSTDGTIEYLQSQQNIPINWISEKDKGIYDAMNKGLKLAKGEFVWFLNAGDYLHHEDALNEVLIETPKFDLYYGDTEMITPEGVSLGLRRGGVPEQLELDSLKTGMKVSHQSILVRRSVALEFDATYRLVGDLDWLIRLLKIGIRVQNLHQIVSRFTIGGASGKQWNRAMKERWRCLQYHYGFWATLWSHILILLKAPFVRLRWRY
jgi:glycosyltransferase involved in cell wall biosynthesis